MERTLFAAGALLGLIGVAAGAFGAHGLRDRIGAEALGWWETAVRYQVWHALAILLAAVVGERLPAARAAGRLFVVGTVVFSGTLYAMALGGPRWLGAVTPVGGLLLMAGWAVLAYAAWRR